MDAPAMAEPERYDVFVCHRSETKRKLVSHVKARLQRSSLRVFVDDELEKGCDSWPTILESLRGAQRVLIILSPDFESSPWCLEELWAATQRPNFRSTILPVFYDREPDDVDDAKLHAAWGEYKQSCVGPLVTRDGVLQRWHKALQDVSGISGWVFKSATECDPVLQGQLLPYIMRSSVDCAHFCGIREEAKLVDEVQAKLLHIFRAQARLPAEHAVGLETRVAELKQKLQAGQVYCIFLLVSSTVHHLCSTAVF